MPLERPQSSARGRGSLGPVEREPARPDRAPGASQVIPAFHPDRGVEALNRLAGPARKTRKGLQPPGIGVSGLPSKLRQIFLGNNLP